MAAVENPRNPAKKPADPPKKKDDPKSGEKMSAEDFDQLTKLLDEAGVDSTQVTFFVSMVTFAWSPNVKGAFSLIGAWADMLGLMNSVKEVSTLELSLKLDALKEQITQLQAHMDQSFEKLDRRIGEIANEIDWTYALLTTQPYAVFISETCWERFQDLATGESDDNAKDELAKEFLQTNAGALANQLKEYYSGIVGAQLSQPDADLSLISVFLKTSWEKFTKGVDDKNAYACDYVFWVNNVQVYTTRLLKHLMQGITLHLWSLKRIRPHEYDRQKKTYDEKWIPDFHAKLRKNLPLMTVDYFDPTMWTNAGQQPPATFRIHSVQRSDHTLTRGDPSGITGDKTRVPLLVDNDGKWSSTGRSNSVVPDWKSRADLTMPFIGDPKLGFRIIVQGGKYLSAPPNFYQPTWLFEDPEDPVPERAQFRFASSNTTWIDRDTYMLIKRGTSLQVAGSQVQSFKAFEEGMVPKASDFVEGDFLQIHPNSGVNTYFPNRVRFRVTVAP